MTAPSKRTARKEKIFLDALREGKSVTAAAIKARIGRQSAYDWRKLDADFAYRWDDAVEEGTDKLEDEAYRRANDGTAKPMWHKGVVVGHINEYSDTLMIFLLKGRRRAKFGDRHEVTGKDGGAIEFRTLADFYGAITPKRNDSDEDPDSGAL